MGKGKKPGEKGGKGGEGGQDGENPTSKEFAQMAARQAAIRKQLEKKQKELQGQGKGDKELQDLKAKWNFAAVNDFWLPTPVSEFQKGYEKLKAEVVK